MIIIMIMMTLIMIMITLANFFLALCPVVEIGSAETGSRAKAKRII